MAYDYRKAVLHDAEQVIRENTDTILEHFGAEDLKDIDRKELSFFADSLLLNNNSVTGAGKSGYKNGYQFEEDGLSLTNCLSAEAFIGKEEMIAEAFKASGNEQILGSHCSISIERIDTELRTYALLNDKDGMSALDEAIQNVIDSPDKQVSEPEKLELQNPDYESDDYPKKAIKAIESYLKQNIDDILEEADINSVEEYEQSAEFEKIVFEKIESGEVELPEASEFEIAHNIKAVLSNSNLDVEGYTVTDYFENKDVADYVNNAYEKQQAVSNAWEAYDNVFDRYIEPAIEKREAEQEIEIDD